MQRFSDACVVALIGTLCLFFSLYCFRSYDTSFSIMCRFGVNPRFFNLSRNFVFPFSMHGLVIFLVVWLGCCLHRSGMLPVCSFSLCMVALEISW